MVLKCPVDFGEGRPSPPVKKGTYVLVSPLRGRNVSRGRVTRLGSGSRRPF